MKKIRLFLLIVVWSFLMAGCVDLTTSNQEKPFKLESMRVHFLNVGQGNAVFIEGGEGQTLLYDVGGDGDVGKQIVDYIQKCGYESLDVMVISHPHADHMNGAPYILEKIKVHAVYHPKVTHTTQLFEDFVQGVKKANLSLKPVKAGMEIPFGNMQVKVLGPCSDYYEGLNDYSVVLQVKDEHFSVLLTGDIEALAEEEVISSGKDLHADVLQVPHHGSSSSSTQDFLQKVNPKYSILSLAADNKYGHPHKEVMERLVKLDTEILRTDEQGTIVASYQGDALVIETEKGIQTPNMDKKYIDEKTGQGLIKGNKNSKVYHMPEGAHYDSVKEDNVIWFQTEREAVNAGYRRSKR
ncbi:MAG: MBL fold metallo-hydrolase [Epulopiscium sp.]|nr:MBL fold metallo-hydrolase [Candidatus Epulonipiscium sp.]